MPPTTFRPMLAATLDDPSTLRYPVIATPKIDGIRCVMLQRKALSRTLKPIRNDHIRTTLERVCPDDFDGELLSGDTFQACTSAVSSKEGKPDFIFWVFDLIDLQAPYHERIGVLERKVKELGHPAIRYVPHFELQHAEHLAAYERVVLDEGFEGVMLRTPEGPYKLGRSTTREGYLLKLKRFTDAEAEIIGFEEMMHNENALTRDARGYAKRSSAKAGKTPAGILGKFKVRDLQSGVEFEIGTGVGLTMELRDLIWQYRKKYLGKIVRYTYQAAGTKDAPRIPIFQGIRDPDDMGSPR